MLRSSCDKSLKSVCSDNVNKLISVHLNINSMRSTFELLKEQIKDNVDILMISETKINFLLKVSVHHIVIDYDSNGG